MRRLQRALGVRTCRGLRALGEPIARQTEDEVPPSLPAPLPRHLERMARYLEKAARRERDRHKAAWLQRQARAVIDVSRNLRALASRRRGEARLAGVA